MSTDPEADVLTQEVTTEAPATDAAEAVESGASETPPAAQAAQDSPEDEAKALDIGWMQKADWVRLGRDADQWRPAKEFLRRGETYLPIIKAERERERRERQRLEGEMREMPNRIRAELERTYADRFKRLEGMSRVALDKQREHIWHQFEEKKRSAVADGNMQAYDKYNSDQRQALSEFNADTEVEEPAPAAKPSAQPQDQTPPEVQTWVEQNRWFSSDPVLRAFATKEHGRLLRETPGISIEENLRRTTEATKKKFPEEFGMTPPTNGQTQAQPHAPGVEGGGRQAQGSGSRAKGWNEINQDDRRVAERSQLQYFLPVGMEVENASAADLKKARDDYAHEYWKQG